MTHSESISNIAPALLKAQKKIGGAIKGSVNPFFHSKYADLGSVMEACKEALNDNGIIVLQPLGEGTLETILLHETGEWISSITRIVAKSDNNPQDQGSAITYFRRYALQSIMFIPAEDDDGNKAVPEKTATTKQMVRFNQLVNKLQLDPDETKGRILKLSGVSLISELSERQMEDYILKLEEKLKTKEVSE